MTKAKPTDVEKAPSRQGAWFRMQNRQMWHSEANREYGVLWSHCGIRALLGQVVTQEALPEDGTTCARCGAANR